VVWRDGRGRKGWQIGLIIPIHKKGPEKNGTTIKAFLPLVFQDKHTMNGFYLPVDRTEHARFEKLVTTAHDPEFPNVRLWILYV